MRAWIEKSVGTPGSLPGLGFWYPSGTTPEVVAHRRQESFLFDSAVGEWLPSRQVSSATADSSGGSPVRHGDEVMSNCPPPMPGTASLQRARSDLIRLYGLLAVMGMLTLLLAFLSGVASGIGTRFRSYILRTSYGLSSRLVGEGYLADLGCLFAWVAFEVTLVIVAHRIARKEPMTYGSAVPEMRCALQGTDLKNYFGPRLLWVRALSLALSETSGLPVGKEGPFVHMAAIIGNQLLHVKAFHRVVHIPTFWSQILAASVAVGSCSAFGVPIGGVLFALEVMPDSCWRNSTYWSSLWACVFASFALRMMNAVVRIDITWPVTLKMSDPIVSLLPHQAGHSEASEAAGNFDHLYFVVASAVFGALCGLLGCLYIRTQTYVSRHLRPWLAGDADNDPSVPQSMSQRWKDAAGKVRGVLEEPLIERESHSYGYRVFDLGSLGARARRIPWFSSPWSPSRGTVLCAAVAAVDAVVNFALPMLRRNSQPSLLWEITSHPGKSMSSPGSNGELVLPHDIIWSSLPRLPAAMGLLGVKWVLVSFVLCLPLPSGCIIPLYVLGALIGRVALDILDMLGFTILLQFNGEIILVFATAFTASICRSVSVCLAVFEIVAIPSLMLPLSAAGMVAVYVSNALMPSIFEAISKERRLPAVPQPRTLLDGMVPVTTVMRQQFPVVPQSCSSATSLAYVKRQLEEFPEDREFAVVDGSAEQVKAGERLLPVGFVYRWVLEELCYSVPTPASTPQAAEAAKPSNLKVKKAESDNLVCFQGNDLLPAPHVPPSMTVKHVLDVMELYASTVVFICRGGHLVGMLNYADILVLANRGKLPSAPNLLLQHD